jgi:hypothetical protein
MKGYENIYKRILLDLVVVGVGEEREKQNVLWVSFYSHFTLGTLSPQICSKKDADLFLTSLKLKFIYEHKSYSNLDDRFNKLKTFFSPNLLVCIHSRKLCGQTSTKNHSRFTIALTQINLPALKV